MNKEIRQNVSGPCRFTLGLLPAALVAFSLTASAQERDEAMVRVERGEYTVISNVTRADVLSEDMASQYELPRDADHAMLNVTVYRDDMPVEADIGVEVSNLIGQQRNVEMRATRSNGYVSYIAAVMIGDAASLDFALEVLPEMVDEPIALEFKEDFRPR